MTRTRTTFLRILDDLEVAYKFSFKVMDKAIYDVVSDPEKETSYVRLTYAAKDNVTWAEPIPYSRIEQTHQVIFAQLVVNTFMSVGRLLESYLRLVCRQALGIAPPVDDSWFSFDELATLSGIGEAELKEVVHYAKACELMKFVKETYSSNIDLPAKTVTHNDVLNTFGNLRQFVADFEAAFIIANIHVKEEDI